MTYVVDCECEIGTFCSAVSVYIEAHIDNSPP